MLIFKGQSIVIDTAKRLKKGEKMYTKTNEIITETKTVSKTFKKLMDWESNCFESSSSKTPEFMAFARMFKSFIIKEASKNGLDLISFNTGHFYCSGFLKNRSTANYIYFSISDVRYNLDQWIHNILIRTASSDKDYTGGRNQYATLQTIGEYALNLTN